MVKILLAIFIILPLGIFAQTKDKVEVLPQILSENLKESCEKLELGQIIFFYEPDYPAEFKTARIGGNVNVFVKVGVEGNIGEIVKIEGNQNFKEIAEKAAQKIKFSPTFCNGEQTAVNALITYNFVPQISAENYFFPNNSKEFGDVKTDSPYFEAISNLTDNYKISFGYSDKKFYENAPLTRGDFAQFLHLTLDLLFKRAKDSSKIPSDIKLNKPFNPYNLTSVNSIKDLEKKLPFYKSVAVLLQTYNIAIVSKDSKFFGKTPMTMNEVIDIWTNIFGQETIPVNFKKTEIGEQIITRGEFALFLHESMQVLSYKVMP